MQPVEILLPACGGPTAAAAIRLFQAFMGRVGADAAVATCVTAVATQHSTAVAINRALYCGFPQVSSSTLAIQLYRSRAKLHTTAQPLC